MKKGGGSESTIIIGPSKSVLVYALHSLENVLGLARFRMFVPKLYYYIIIKIGLKVSFDKTKFVRWKIPLYSSRRTSYLEPIFVVTILNFGKRSLRTCCVFFCVYFQWIFCSFDHKKLQTILFQTAFCQINMRRHFK